MTEYWTVSVELKVEQESGKIQKLKELYLVDAATATEAEAKIYQEFDGEHNFAVISAVKSKILKVLN